MSIIVFNCQHCDEQQFHTLSCLHYPILSVVNLGLFIRALLQDLILALGKTTRTLRVHLVIHKHSYTFSLCSTVISDGASTEEKNQLAAEAREVHDYGIRTFGVAIVTGNQRDDFIVRVKHL